MNGKCKENTHLFTYLGDIKRIRQHHPGARRNETRRHRLPNLQLLLVALVLVPQHFIHGVFAPEHGGLVEAVAKDRGGRAVPEGEDALIEERKGRRKG